MSGAALGMVTALALAAGTPRPAPQAGWQDLRFGVRPAPAQQPLFGLVPEARTQGEPKVVCKTPVIHGDPAQVDPRFVVPVPREPKFTMRWAPSTPCDPSLGEQREDDASPTPRKR